LVSPLQLALAASSLSNEGTRPAPRIATALADRGGIWNSLPALGVEADVFTPEAAGSAQDLLSTPDLPFWEAVAVSDSENGEQLTWYMVGTTTNWQGAPLVLILILEEDSPGLAQEIGRQVINIAVQ
jgi:hypothetical protein